MNKVPDDWLNILWVGEKIMKWDLTCSNDKSIIKGVVLTSSNTDIRCDGEWTLYANKIGSIIGPHLLTLFQVRCCPQSHGIVIHGYLRDEVEGKVIWTKRRYFATPAKKRRSNELQRIHRKPKR